MPSDMDTLKDAIEKHRITRVRRSNLLHAPLESNGQLFVKIAETVNEYEQSFRLTHDVYLHMGYIRKPQPYGLLCGIHSLLPETVIFVVKLNGDDVVSTLTEIPDTEAFGLPMDAIYKRELDALRNKGRRIAELSALVISPNYRGKNLFMPLVQAMYQYSRRWGVDDLCITVNPKHINFYKHILLFEDFGSERHYPRVNAPAVALRVNMHHIAERLRQTYDSHDPDTNLYVYFHSFANNSGLHAPTINSSNKRLQNIPTTLMKDKKTGIVQHFLNLYPSFWNNLNSTQKFFFLTHYPNLQNKIAITHSLERQ